METLSYTITIFSAIFNKPSSIPSKSDPPPRSPYKKHPQNNREPIIKTLEHLCEHFNTPTYIKHICTNIYDSVNQSKPYPQSFQFTLLTICLSLAYKYESDNDFLIPSQLLPLDATLTPHKIMRLELELMDLINWQINRKNSIYYIHEICNKALSGQKLNKILNHACTLADLTLRMENFLNADPKTVACTCIAFALKKLGAKNSWTTEGFERVSGLSLSSLRIAELETKYNQVISAC